MIRRILSVDGAVRTKLCQMSIDAIERSALACAAIALFDAAPAAAADLVSPSYRLRGGHVAVAGGGWLTSTAPSPTLSDAAASLGQSEAIGPGFASSDFEASWPGFFPIVAGGLPSQDRDGDGAPDTVEASPPSGPGTDPFDPDTDADGLCDGPPSSLPACALGGEDLNGNGVYDPGVETDPNLTDTDGDGYSDGFERSEGSDPLDPGSVPGGGVEVPALGAPGSAILMGLIGLIGSLGLRSKQGKKR
jgi:hypothetical protein